MKRHGCYSQLSFDAGLRERVAMLVKEHRFDCDNGWAQVDGKGDEAHRAYGEFRMLHDIAEEFGIEVPR